MQPIKANRSSPIFNFLLVSVFFFSSTLLKLTQPNGLVVVGSLYLIVLILGYIFQTKESIVFDSQNLTFDLQRYKGVINADTIRELRLEENTNDLYLETNESKHTYKLNNFNRKKILELILSINSNTKKRDRVESAG